MFVFLYPYMIISDSTCLLSFPPKHDMVDMWTWIWEADPSRLYLICCITQAMFFELVSYKM